MTGQPGRRSRVSDEDIVAVFEAVDDPVLTTAEVSEALPIGHRAAYQRLEQLSDRDVLDNKKVGSSGIVWWHPDSPQ